MLPLAWQHSQNGIPSEANKMVRPRREIRLTFNADDVLSDLLGQQWVRHQFDEVVDGVDGGVDGLEPLDLMSDGHRRSVDADDPTAASSSHHGAVARRSLHHLRRPVGRWRRGRPHQAHAHYPRAQLPGNVGALQDRLVLGG